MNRRKETANKGFSLVELIIVVAIMAVLIGVLAPQYLKYVERSRESADLDNYQAIITALQVSAADSDSTATKVVDGTIVCDANGRLAFNPATNETVLKEASADPSKITIKSTKYKGKTITITVTDGVPTFTADDAALAGALGIGTTTP